jgi:iron complex outermembrane receptor protein
MLGLPRRCWQGPDKRPNDRAFAADPKSLWFVTKVQFSSVGDLLALRFALACALLTAVPGGAARAQTVGALKNLSIEQLARLEVSSVTKSAETLNEALSSIYVISNEAIQRSGYQTIPEILRLAPNLFVAQTNPNRYSISARGLSGNDAAQNFTNKLLVLIDGRSVYTPIFSGVYWDQQDVSIADIDRIEVISGTGSTLWGANAVDGVVNIITRGAAASQGLAADLSAGSQERSAAVRYGGQVGTAISYRAYVRAYDAVEFRTPTNDRAGDGWSRIQGGARVDWAGASDRVTVQGDVFDGGNDLGSAPDSPISGGNILARWTRQQSDANKFELQAYYDNAHRGGGASGLAFTVETYDLNLQQNLSVGRFNTLVFGGGVRLVDYDIEQKRNFFFAPPSRTLTIGNVFVQDSIRFSQQFKAVLGLKAEVNAFSGFDLLPSIRLAYTPNNRTLLWAAVSRAIRSPTPFDHDVVEKVGDLTIIAGNPNFRTERLVTYEGGARLRFGKSATLSMSAFYNTYDQLRNLEFTNGRLPLFWGNGARAETYGLELWGDLAVTPWWRLSGSFNWLEVDANFRPGASALLGTSQFGNDPRFRASLGSMMTIGGRIDWTAQLRFVDTLPQPRVPSYAELDTRAAWRVTDHFEVAIVGRNLLHAYHQEFAPPADRIPRSVLGQVRWRY